MRAHQGCLTSLQPHREGVPQDALPDKRHSRFILRSALMVDATLLALPARIKQLAPEGIASGCGAGNFCPDANVTRDQMAVFLVKTFNLP